MLRLFPSALMLLASACTPLSAHEFAPTLGRTSASGLCASDWRAQFPASDLECVTTPSGAAIARGHEVQALSGAMDYAYASFSRHFSPPDRRVAIVAAPTLTDEQRKYLDGFGYLALSWIDDASRAELQRNAVRRQVEAQTSALPEAEREAIVAQAMARLPAVATSNQAPDATERGAASHEAGHLFLIDFFGIEPSDDSEVKQYGSVAPDWLDEVAAVIAENDELTDGRYAAARRSLAEGKTVPAYPISDFLSMEHPSLGATRRMMARLKDAGSETKGTMMLTGEEAKRFLAESGGDPVQFYIQSRMFADYLIERSQNQRIFLEIATDIRDGGNFGDWLIANGAKHGLPASMTALQADWQVWTQKRLTAED